MTKPQALKKSYPYYSLALLVSGLAVLFVAWRSIGPVVDVSPMTLLVVFALCLFSIAVGYPHPSSGHVSFDRVGQVATLLVFGPIVAASISAVASFVYPIHRIAHGVAVKDVLLASLHNTGLMIWVVLGGGLFYTFAGGPVPLGTLTFASLVKVIVDVH